MNGSSERFHWQLVRWETSLSSICLQQQQTATINVLYIRREFTFLHSISFFLWHFPPTKCLRIQFKRTTVFSVCRFPIFSQDYIEASLCWMTAHPFKRFHVLLTINCFCNSFIRVRLFPEYRRTLRCLWFFRSYVFVLFTPLTLPTIRHCCGH